MVRDRRGVNGHEVLLSVLSTTGAVDEALSIRERMHAVTTPEQRANFHLAMAREASR